MTFIKVECKNCSWSRVATSEEDSAISIPELFALAQSHVNKEDHEIVVSGSTKPTGK
jgi:hypothetical protein